MTAARAQALAPKTPTETGRSGPIKLGRAGERAEQRAEARAAAVLATPAAPAGPGAMPPAGRGGPGLSFEGGRPLSINERGYFEPRFGRDFGAVRVHGGAASLAARAIGARAFALGGDIAVAETSPSRVLVAHELAHVVDGEAGVVRRDLRDEVTRRDITPAEVRKLDDKNIQRLLVFVETLLLPPNPDDPALLANYGVIREVAQERSNRLQAEAAKRAQAAEPTPAAGRGTPNVTASNPLIKAMGVFSSIRQSDQASGLWKGEIEGRPITLNAAQYGQLRTRVVREANNAIQRADSRASMAAGRYAEQQKVDAHHWIIAPIVKTLGRVSDPGPALSGFVANAQARLTEARTALAAGDFDAVARLTGEGEAAAEQAGLMVAAYVDQIIGSAEMTVTVLEGIKTASTVILFVCAVAATGGLAGAGATALGLEGVGGATTLFGVTASTATWATVVGAGAAITEEVALGIARAAEGEKVDWGAIAVHAAIQVIVARFSPGAGQQLTKGLGKAAVANPALRGLIARVGMQRVVAVATTVILHEATQLFSTAVEDTVVALRGQPVTWAQFGEHLWARVTDPKGLIMATVAASLGGLQPEPEPGASPGPASTGQPPSKKSPTDTNDWRDVNKGLGLGKTPPAPQAQRTKTDNADWRDVNREVGLVKPRTKVTQTPDPPPGHRQVTAEEAFQPTAQERADAFAKEPPGRSPPPKDAAEAFRHTPEEQRAAFDQAAQAQPEGLPKTATGEPIRESSNASPKGDQFVAGRAQTKRGVITGPRADIGESSAYKAALRAGEIGLERPQGINVRGRDDFITAAPDPSGKMWIIASDAKTRSSAAGQFEKPTPGLRKGWDAQVKAAVERANLGDPKLEAEIQAAYREGRVWVRQVNVDLSPQGQGGISGVAAPKPVPWGAFTPRPDFDKKDDRAE